MRPTAFDCSTSGRIHSRCYASLFSIHLRLARRARRQHFAHRRVAPTLLLAVRLAEPGLAFCGVASAALRATYARDTKSRPRLHTLLLVLSTLFIQWLAISGPLGCFSQLSRASRRVADQVGAIAGAWALPGTESRLRGVDNAQSAYPRAACLINSVTAPGCEM
jgi:hypothetical protein